MLGLERLKIWAAFLDPKAVAFQTCGATFHHRCMTVYLISGVLRAPSHDSYRWILHAAALMHDVGRAKTNSGHHKASARLVKKLVPPLGWTAGELRVAALVVRYHRGALPMGSQKDFAALAPSKQRLVQFLGGILRLACACDWEQNSQIAELQVQSLDSVIKVRAKGYVESTPLSEHIAAARHLLELTCRRPIFVMAAEHMAEVSKGLAQVQAA